MNTNFNIGGQSYRFATSAENVKYGTGTVKEFLDDIKSFDTSGMSEFGKKLYAADEKEFKRLLEISSEGIWDVGQNRWNGTAIVTDDTTAHGGKVLYLEETNLQTAAPIEFGGDPFEITFWLYIGNVLGNFFRALGTTKSFGLARELVSGVGEADARSSLFFKSGTTSLSISSSTPRWTYGANNKWTLIKLEYDGSSSLKIYQNDSLKKTVSMTIAREPRRLVFGGMTGYIDDFELVDNGVTVSKLNFE